MVTGVVIGDGCGGCPAYARSVPLGVWVLLILAVVGEARVMPGGEGVLVS